MLNSSKKTVILLVVLFFLLAMVIYSPSVKIDVFGQASCVWSNNHTHAKCCQYYGYSYTTPTPKRICYECDFNTEAHTQKCTDWFGEEPVAPPPPASPPPPSTLGPPPSTSSEQPTTCPDGSIPDANGVCHASTGNQNPQSLTNNNPENENGNNNNLGGSTPTKKSNNDNSAAPPTSKYDLKKNKKAG